MNKVFIDHYVAQVWGIDYKLINSKKDLLGFSLKLAKQLNLNVVKSFVHKFEPQGLSIVLVISESHLAIHTWPEIGYMNIDVLSCSQNSRLEKLPSTLQKELKTHSLEVKKLEY